MLYVEQMIALERDQQVSRERNTVGFSGLTKSNDAKCEHGREDANSCWGCHPEKHPNNIKCKDCGVKGHKPKGSAKCSKADSPTGVGMLAASGYKTSH
jgi:hypothetical protein